MAMEATRACEPSPPAMPRQSAPLGDRVPCQVLEVEAVIEHDHLHSEFLGQVGKSELGHLAPA